MPVGNPTCHRQVENSQQADKQVAARQASAGTSATTLRQIKPVTHRQIQ
ncbi:MAG: hypothetical protein H6661_07860 [Ardenticatenaceae bacterium]|nr:hypothetical protein [Ardenticatenaceae bacterium]